MCALIHHCSYLFSEVQELIDEVWSHSSYSITGGSVIFRQSDLGLVPSSSARGDDRLVLLAPTIVFVTCIFQIKMLWRYIIARRSEAYRSMQRMAYHPQSEEEPVEQHTDESITQLQHRALQTLSPLSRQVLKNQLTERLKLNRRQSLNTLTPDQTEPRIKSSILLDPNVAPEARVGFDLSLIKSWLDAFILLLHRLLLRCGAHVLALWCFVGVSLLRPVSLADGFYVLILVLLLPYKRGAHLWLPLSLLAAPLVLSRYMFQFQSVIETSSPSDAATVHLAALKWFAYEEFPHSRLFAGLYGELLLLVLATLYRVAILKQKRDARKAAKLELQRQRQTEEDAARAATAQEVAQSSVRLSLRNVYNTQQQQQQPLLHDQPPLAPSATAPAALHLSDFDASLAPDEPVRSLSLHTQNATEQAQADARAWHLFGSERWLFARFLVKDLALRFMNWSQYALQLYAVESVVLFALLTAYQRSNVLSLFYVFVVTGGFTFGGRSTVRRMWPLLLVVTGASLIWQYAVLIGLPPSSVTVQKHEALAFGVVSESGDMYKQWYLMSGFEARDMMLDFCLFFFVCLGLPYYKSESPGTSHPLTSNATRQQMRRVHPAPVTPPEIELNASLHSARNTSEVNDTAIRVRHSLRPDPHSPLNASHRSHEVEPIFRQEEDLRQLARSERRKERRQLNRLMRSSSMHASIHARIASSNSLKSLANHPQLQMPQSTAKPVPRARSQVDVTVHDDDDDEKTEVQVADVTHEQPLPLPLNSSADTQHSDDPLQHDSEIDPALLAMQNQSLQSSIHVHSSWHARVARMMFPSLVFTVFLIVDKLIFLFIFIVASLHIDLLSIGYLAFAMVSLFQTDLYSGRYTQFHDMWRQLRLYNFFVLSVLALYQLPYIPYQWLPAVTMRWESVIGLRKFHASTNMNELAAMSAQRQQTLALQQSFGSSAVNGLRSQPIVTSSMVDEIVVDGLSTKGAMHSVAIFCLVELMFIIMSSRLYAEVQSYYEQLRSQALMRGKRSAYHRQNQQHQRIMSILSVRESMEASFASIFVLASQQLRADLFKDDTTWSIPKPKDFDEKVIQQVGLDERIKRQHTQAAQRARAREEAHARQVEHEAALRKARRRSQKIDRRQQLRMRRQRAEEDDSDSRLTSSDSSDSSIDSGTGSDSDDSPLRSSDLLPSTAPTQRKGLLSRSLHSARRWLSQHTDPALWCHFSPDTSDDEIQRHSQLHIIVNNGVEHSAASQMEHLSLLTLMYRYVVTHSEWLVYAAFIANLLTNASLLASVIPVLIFCYAIFENPRPTKGFWLFAMFYECSCVVLKFVFQLSIFCVTIIDRRYTLAPTGECDGAYRPVTYSTDYLLGLRKLSSESFAAYVLWDLICMLLIVWHRQSLAGRGLWDSKESDLIGNKLHPDIAARLQARDRRDLRRQPSAHAQSTSPSISRVKARTGQNTPPLQQQMSQSSLLPMQRVDTRASQMPLHSKNESVDRDAAATEAEAPESSQAAQASEPLARSATQSNLDSSDLGLDAFESHDDVEARAASFLSSIRIQLRRLWALCAPIELRRYYGQLIPRERLSHVNVKKPGRDLYLPMFTVELACAAVILTSYGRMATTSGSSQSSSQSLTANVFFSGAMVLTLFLQILIIILDRTIYLFRSVMSKILLQYSTVVYWMLHVFFVWPVAAQTGFVSNPVAILFALLKCVYFLLSGMQISQGYPPVEQTGFEELTQHPGIWTVYLFRAYRSVV